MEADRVNEAQKQDSGGGATRLLPRDGGVEELHGDPTVGPRGCGTVK